MKITDCWGNPKNICTSPGHMILNGRLDSSFIGSKSIFLPKGDTCTFTNTEQYRKDMRELITGKIKTTCSGIIWSTSDLDPQFQKTSLPWVKVSDSEELVDVTTMSDKQPVYAPVSRPVIDMSDSSSILDAIMRAGGIEKYRDKVHERHKDAYSTQEELDYKAACEELGLSATETALKLALEEQTKYDSGKDRRNAGKKNHNIFYYLYRIFTFHRSPRET